MCAVPSHHQQAISFILSAATRARGRHLYPHIATANNRHSTKTYQDQLTNGLPRGAEVRPARVVLAWLLRCKHLDRFASSTQPWTWRSAARANELSRRFTLFAYFRRQFLVVLAASRGVPCVARTIQSFCYPGGSGNEGSKIPTICWSHTP
jgi:hypothetical protein